MNYKDVFQLAKEKGYFLTAGEPQNDGKYFDSKINYTELCLIQKWLRDEHDITVESLVFDKGFLEKGKFCYQWWIYDKKDDPFTNITEYKTYEQALLEGIYEALKLLP